MNEVPSFRRALEQSLASCDLIVDRWHGGTRSSWNLIEISTMPKSTVLYTKASGLKNGFWGITKTHINQLQNKEVRWFVVLLHRSDDSGYLLSGGQVIHRIMDKTFEYSSGDYKIHESTDLARVHAFRGIDSLILRIL